MRSLSTFSARLCSCLSTNTSGGIYGHGSGASRSSMMREWRYYRLALTVPPKRFRPTTDGHSFADKFQTCYAEELPRR